MPNVLDGVTHYGVIVESQSRELLQELALQNLLRERGESETLTVESIDRLSNCNFAFLIHLWINSSRVQMLGDSLVSGSLYDCVQHLGGS